MIIYGTSQFGKVDHAPGLFYVTTTFFHVWFIPLVPTGSHLIIDDGTGESGVSIGLSLKSWFMAWLRGGCFLAGVVMLSNGLASKISPINPIETKMWIGFGGAGLIALGIVSYFIIGIGRNRAAMLAEYAGLDPDFVHAHFDQIEGVETPRRQREDRFPTDAGKRWNSHSE